MRNTKYGAQSGVRIQQDDRGTVIDQIVVCSAVLGFAIQDAELTGQLEGVVCVTAGADKVGVKIRHEL